jgi:hypothetical protein
MDGPKVTSLRQLAELLEMLGELFVRFSAGPEAEEVYRAAFDPGRV